MPYDISGFKVPEGVERETFQNICSAAYTAYLGLGGNLPNLDDVKRYSNAQKRTIAKVMDTDEFASVLKSRGINWDKTRGLTTKQHLAISVITDPHDRRTFAKKLASIGATSVEYRAWMKQPLFKRKVEDTAEKMLGENVSQVHNALVGKATTGDTRAIQLYYELTGRHDPASKQVADMQVIIGLLLEIITKNVTDISALTRINEAIEKDVLPKMITGTVLRSD